MANGIETAKKIAVPAAAGAHVKGLNHIRTIMAANIIKVLTNAFATTVKSDLIE